VAGSIGASNHKLHDEGSCHADMLQTGISSVPDVSGLT